MNKITIVLILSILPLLCFAKNEKFVFSPQQKLLMAEKVISSFYVDSVSQDKLVESAIIGMLKQLDPHSVYSDPEETRELTTSLEGNFSGIGISFNMINDTLHVINTIAEGPSEKVGIIAGDKIIAAGDSIISGVGRKNSSVMSLLRGEKGTVVKLKVIRKNEPEPLEFLVTRDNIPVESVTASFMAADGVGYIKLTRFAENSFEEIKNAINKLKKKGMQSLILDLTDNTGGHMNAAIEIAGQFLPDRSVIVSTKAPKMGDDVEFFAKNAGKLKKEKLVVLVNQFSASASEIVSGAIQDYDRGVIVGRRTFGKGLVQRPFPMPDGSMIRVTVARYYTPSGRSIQKPYTLGHSEEYDSEMLDRFNSGEFFHQDSVHFDESLKYKTINKGREIYGGGGIMPDIFVPADTTYSTPTLRKLIASNLFVSFCQEYIEDNKDKLKKEYATEDDFISNFKVTEDLLEQFKKYIAKNHLEINNDEFGKSLVMIKTNIKALIARQLFSASAFYRVVMPMDPIYNEGLRVIQSDESYNSMLDNQKK